MDTELVPEGNTAPDAALASEQVVEGATEVVADTPQSIDIDGQSYTLDELKSGIMRQADYTRKTQEVAADRQRLQKAEAVWNALFEDPAGTIEALQEHFADALQPQEPVDPDDARWQKVESFMHSQQEREAIAAVDNALDSLESQYGEFDREALLEHAMNNEIGNLRAALFDMRATNPEYAAAQQRAAADAAAIAAKQALPPVAGGSAAAGSTQRGGKPILKPRDALTEALAELGISSISDTLR